MELKDFLGYVAANGISASPQIEEAKFDPIPGYVPPTYIVWRKENGSKLQQGFNVISEAEDPFSYLWEIQAFFGEPKVTKVNWKNYLHPVVEINDPPKAGVDSVVGEVFDAENKLFYVKAANIQEGAKYVQPKTNRKFIAVRTSPFTIHWKEL